MRTDILEHNAKEMDIKKRRRHTTTTTTNYDDADEEKLKQKEK